MAGCELDPRHARPARRRRPPHHAPRACSRPATCCTRPRPPTSPRSTAATSPPRSPPTCAAPASGRPHVPVVRARAAALGRAESARRRPVTRRRGRVPASLARVPARAAGRGPAGGRGALAAGGCGGSFPGRSAHIPAGWAAQVDPDAGRVRWRSPGCKRVADERRGLLLGIDEGTTGVKAALFDERLQPVARGAPRQGQPPSRGGLGRAGRQGGARGRHRGDRRAARRTRPARSSPAGSTTRASRCSPGTRRRGEPLSPIVVWQDKRSQEILDELAEQRGGGPGAQRPALRPLLLRRQAGLAAASTTTACKKARDAGTLRMGTVDSFLCDRLGAGFATEPSTASRTQLQRIDTPGLRRAPLRDLRRPDGRPARDPRHRRRARHAAGTRAGRSSFRFRGQVVDQQAALAGAACVEPGRVKATYGTGVFVLAHVGEERAEAGRRPAADRRLEHRRQARVRARRRRLRRRGDARVDVQRARASPRTRPRSASWPARPRARPGPGCCPGWRASARPGGGPNARAVISGIYGGTTRANVARAALEGIAWRVADVVAAIRETRPVETPAGRRRPHQRAADAAAAGRLDRRAGRGRRSRRDRARGRRARRRWAPA